MADVSSGPFTRTLQRRRRSSNSQAPDLDPSPTRWWTRSTNTAPTENSSPSSLPRVCRSAWTLWPSTITCGRSREQAVHWGSDGNKLMERFYRLFSLLGRTQWCGRWLTCDEGGETSDVRTHRAPVIWKHTFFSFLIESSYFAWNTVTWWRVRRGCNTNDEEENRLRRWILLNTTEYSWILLNTPEHSSSGTKHNYRLAAEQKHFPCIVTFAVSAWQKNKTKKKTRKTAQQFTVYLLVLPTVQYFFNESERWMFVFCFLFYTVCVWGSVWVLVPGYRTVGVSVYCTLLLTLWNFCPATDQQSKATQHVFFFLKAH